MGLRRKEGREREGNEWERKARWKREEGGDEPLLPLPDGTNTWLRVGPQVFPSSAETTLLTENVPSERPSVVSNTHISFGEPSLKSTCVSCQCDIDIVSSVRI